MLALDYYSFAFLTLFDNQSTFYVLWICVKKNTAIETFTRRESGNDVYFVASAADSKFDC